MAHFAKLDENNVVLDVIVVSNDVIENLPFPESEPIGVTFCQSLFGADTVWKQTSYNGNFRGRYAGIGYTYNAELNEFIHPPRPPTVVNMDELEKRVGGIPFSSTRVSVLADESEAP
jgi:hypothetical protein